ncbi:MAG: DUF2799 domain-containing protein [Pseudomonadota bacterium]
MREIIDRQHCLTNGNQTKRSSSHGAVFLFVGLLCLTAACASLSERDCTAGHWHAIGQSDGANGHLADRLSDHNAACAKHGIQPDAAAWEAGRQVGIASYCMPARGYAEGRAGRQISPVCPGGPSLAMQHAHAAGWRHHVLTQEISALDHEIHKVRQELRDTPEDRKKRRRQLRHRLDHLNLSVDRLRAYRAELAVCG